MCGPNMQAVLKAQQNGPNMQAVLKAQQNGPNTQAVLNIHGHGIVQKEEETLGGPNPTSAPLTMQALKLFVTR